MWASTGSTSDFTLDSDVDVATGSAWCSSRVGSFDWRSLGAVDALPEVVGIFGTTGLMAELTVVTLRCRRGGAGAAGCTVGVANGGKSWGKDKPGGVAVETRPGFAVDLIDVISGRVGELLSWCEGSVVETCEDCLIVSVYASS